MAASSSGHILELQEARVNVKNLSRSLSYVASTFNIRGKE